jgi:ABC-type phosphate transport system substrate-binding protein
MFKRVHFISFYFFAFLLICLPACAAATARPITTLRVSGSGGTTPILAAIADGFAADTMGYQLETLQGTGKDGGVQGIIEGVLDIAAMGDIIVAVEGTPGAIGYVNWPTAVALAANVHPLTINGMSPTDADYPATLEIGIGYLPTHEADVKPLLDWIESDAGQDSLIEFGVLVTK